MGTLWRDIRYGCRILRKSPGFTAIALITLAVGIGANTIMFSLVNVMLFRPVLVQDPERLVECKARNAFFPYAAYVNIRDDNPAFSDLVAYAGDLNRVTLIRENVTSRVTSTYVSANYFSGLGVRPARGRWFLPDEEHHGAEPVAVISHRLWRKQGADPEIVGKHVTIEGTVFRIVGVAPRRFTGTAVLGPDLWLPLGTYGLIGHQGRENTRQRKIDLWNYPFLSLLGRLKPGLNMAAAQVQMQSVIPRLKQDYPRLWEDNATLDLHHLSRLMADSGVNAENERFRLALVSLFLMAVSAVVLLIACLNLGNMIVVQGTMRHREIAIRMAIGGGRLRIIRQLLIESLLLAMLGGVMGCVLSFWGTKVLNAWVTSPQFLGFSADLQVGLDVRVLAATFGFCLIATMLFGLKPALRLSKRDVITDIKESGSEAARLSRKRLGFVPRDLSVIGQIALSVVLVMGAALFTRSALYTAGVDPGFSLDNKLLVQIDPLAAGYDRAHSIQVYETLSDHLSTMPGVETAAVSGSFPLCGGGDYGNIIVEYTPGTEDNSPTSRFKRPVYAAHSIRGDFFEAMGIPLLQGRYFNRLDSIPDAEKVVIIDEHLAHKLRPDGSAIGCLIQFGFIEVLSPYRVVGIVPNVRSSIREQKHLPQIYIPITTDQMPRYIHLRIADGQSGTTMLEKVAAEIHRVDPQMAVISVTTLTQEHRNNNEVYAAGLGARMAIVFGAMALFLASLGIYAVKGYMVASRTPEIGIRKALGATHKDIMGMVFREGAVLTIAGLIVGLLLGLGIARLIGSMFYGINPVDPVSIVVTILLLGLASLLAGYLPARHAAKVDPMEALRYE
jgi:predicted permease